MMNEASCGSMNKHVQTTFGSWRREKKTPKKHSQPEGHGRLPLKPQQEPVAAAFHLRLRTPLAGLSGREKQAFSPNSASVGSPELQTYLINSILPGREIPVS